MSTPTVSVPKESRYVRLSATVKTRANFAFCLQSPESRESPSPVDQPTPSSPTGLDGETFPTPVPSPPTESTPATPKSDDCPPCEDKPLPVTTTSSGEVCYCLGGGQPGMNNGNREPWTLAGPSCNEIDNENPVRLRSFQLGFVGIRKLTCGACSWFRPHHLKRAVSQSPAQSQHHR